MTETLHPACQAPQPGEGPAAWQGYLSQCPLGDVRRTLDGQRSEWRLALGGLAGIHDHWTYAPGKWCLARLMGHMADSELVLLERLLRAARGDGGPQPAYDEDAFAALWEPDLAAELGRWSLQRRLVVDLLDRLPVEAWERRGQVEDRAYSVRQLAWMMAGHACHHLAVLKERYLPQLQVQEGAGLRVLRGVDAQRVLNEPGILGFRLGVDGPRRLIRVSLETGAALPPHAVPDRALFWVLGGKGELHVDGGLHLLEAGDAALVEGGAQRGWRSLGNEALELVVVRGWPEDAL